MRWRREAGVILCVICSSGCNDVSAPRRVTVYRLKNGYTAMAIIEEASGKASREQLAGMGELESRQAAWRRLCLDHEESLRMSKEEIVEWLCVDGYGNELNVCLPEEDALPRINEDMADFGFEVVLWSSGKNGINEFGHGDDVYLTEQDVDGPIARAERVAGQSQ